MAIGSNMTGISTTFICISRLITSLKDKKRKKEEEKKPTHKCK